MGKIALYRKYRSRSLDEVIGQKHVTDVLSASAVKGNFSHAYLLTGPRGIGKTSVARIIAHLANNLPYDDADHIDIIEIDAASNTGVDNIRDLRDKANIAPSLAKYKIYIIDEVHMLSTGAFNALLKTLEEPPSHVIFILATTEVQKLPATILSRTQRFHFRPVDTDSVAAHLRKIADAEKIDVDDDALRLMAERGEGSFRDSITLLDQLSNLKQKITVSDVEDIFGLAPARTINQLADATIGHDTKKVVELLAELSGQGITPATIVDQLTVQLAEFAKNQVSLYDLIERLIEVPKSIKPELKLTAILASFANKHTSVAASAVRQPVVVAKEPKTKSPVAKKPSVPNHLDVDTPQDNETPEPKQNPAQSNLPEDFDWDSVVSESKKLNGPAGSLIANANIDTSDGTLTLFFRYGLHRKKMNDQKYKGVLVDAIKNLYGSAPEIVISEGAKPKSETAAAVAAIMGGGEII